MCKSASEVLLLNLKSFIALFIRYRNISKVSISYTTTHMKIFQHRQFPKLRYDLSVTTVWLPMVQVTASVKCSALNLSHQRLYCLKTPHPNFFGIPSHKWDKQPQISGRGFQILLIVAHFRHLAILFERDSLCKPVDDRDR